MALQDLLQNAPYNKKILERLEKPHNCGMLHPKNDFFLAVGRSSRDDLGIKITLYLLVDLADGVIAEAKFQALAPPLVIAAADVLCSQILRKNHAIASRTKPEPLQKQLDDSSVDCRALLEALERACATCTTLPQTPLPAASQESGEGMPGWIALTQNEKLSAIAKVLDEEVKPYVELDEGGIEIVELKENLELKIAYKGACTTCYSSIGSTLNAIQVILQRKIHPDLVVVPDTTTLGL